jgi:carbamoyltransferase
MSNQKINLDVSQEGTPLERRPKKGRLNIVGISAGYHDSACCLISDGILTAAVQEERFSRIKNDRSFPRQSFRYCLQADGLAISDIDCIAYYEDPCPKLGRQIWMGMMSNQSAGRREAIIERLIGRKPEQTIREVTGYDGPIEIVDHHLSHAASSYYFSGYEDAAIFTVDGVGEWATTTYGQGKGLCLERFEQVEFPDSLGLFYSAITGYLGFEVNEGEYKVMGLAPYGEPIYVDRIRKLIEVKSEGQYRLDMRYFAFLTENCMYTQELSSLLGSPPRRPESEITRFHKDVAKSVQVVLEEIMLEKTRYLYGKVPSENLCMAGGVALNVVANGRFLREGPFKRLFVQPAAGDAGGSVGAAAMAYVRLGGEPPQRKRLGPVYLGPGNSSSEVHRILSASSAKFQDFREREDELLRYTVERLIEGKVIGWCQGRMEFGPRSLGARSIIADPRHPDMRDRINSLVKMRESFRPFAPAVLESEASKHFDLNHPSPFMLETCQVISPIALPSITHVDGSARIQTVHADTNKRFAALLQEFYRCTGCPILLNTSFNMRGEPIVCTAVNAITCFVRSKLDLLVLEDFIIDRSGIPSSWDLLAQYSVGERADQGQPVGHLVYTFL